MKSIYTHKKCFTHTETKIEWLQMYVRARVRLEKGRKKYILK